MKKSYRILQLQSYKGTHPSTCNLHMHNYITLQPREFSIQNPIPHAEDKELFEYYYNQKAKRPSVQIPERNSMHRRQGDLLEIHPCVLQDLHMTFQTFQAFQSFMTFQPFQATLQILQCSSISRESTPFQHSPIRMHILHILQFLQFDWFPQKTPPSTS